MNEQKKEMVKQVKILVVILVIVIGVAIFVNVNTNNNDTNTTNTSSQEARINGYTKEEWEKIKATVDPDKYDTIMNYFEQMESGVVDFEENVTIDFSEGEEENITEDLDEDDITREIEKYLQENNM